MLSSHAAERSQPHSTYDHSITDSRFVGPAWSAEKNRCAASAPKLGGLGSQPRTDEHRDRQSNATTMETIEATSPNIPPARNARRVPPRRVGASLPGPHAHPKAPRPPLALDVPHLTPPQATGHHTRRSRDVDRRTSGLSLRCAYLSGVSRHADRLRPGRFLYSIGRGSSMTVGVRECCLSFLDRLSERCHCAYTCLTLRRPGSQRGRGLSSRWCSAGSSSESAISRNRCSSSRSTNGAVSTASTRRRRWVSSAGR